MDGAKRRKNGRLLHLAIRRSASHTRPQAGVSERNRRWKRRLEWSFFLNDRSRITYNELCRKCQHECKQSFRAVVVDCPRYLSKRAKKKEEHTE